MRFLTAFLIAFTIAGCTMKLESTAQLPQPPGQPDAEPPPNATEAAKLFKINAGSGGAQETTPMNLRPGG